MIENQTNKAGTGAWTTGRISSRGNEPLAVKSSSTRGSTHLSMLSIFLSHRDLKMVFFFLSLLMSPYGMHPELLLLVYPLCYNANACNPVFSRSRTWRRVRFSQRPYRKVKMQGNPAGLVASTTVSLLFPWSLFRSKRLENWMNLGSAKKDCQVFDSLAWPTTLLQ